MNAVQHNQIRAGLLADCESILDEADAFGRYLTPDEKARYDAAVSRIKALDEEQPEQPRFNGNPHRLQPSAIVPDFDEPRARIPIFQPGAHLRAFQNNRAGHEAAYRAGKWLQAAILGDEKAINWCANNGVSVDIRAAHSAGDNAKGGVLVPEEMSATIIRLVEQYGVFRQNTRVVPMSSDTLNIPRRTGGLTASYVGENAEGDESDTSWDNVSLVAKKLMVLSRMSSEIAEDAIISMADMLALECALAFALKEDTVGFTGTGSAADGGIVGVLVKALDAAHTKAKVTAAAGHDTFGEIDADDLLDLMAAIPQYAKAGAAWYCSPTAQELVFNAIKIAGGGNTASQLAARQTPDFLGYPINVSTVFPDSSTTDYTGLAMIGFGNLAQASTLGNRRDVRFAVTDQRYWEQDQIGIKATMRHDINIHDLGSTTVKSPFAVLVGGA
jgi:HK97 family phage major capsid protein